MPVFVGTMVKSSRSCWHRLTGAESCPSARDSVNEPDRHDAERQPRDQDANAEGQHHERDAERDPEQTEPERADLPAKVRLEPGPANVRPFDVVEDHGN